MTAEDLILVVPVIMAVFLILAVFVMLFIIYLILFPIFKRRSTMLDDNQEVFIEASNTHAAVYIVRPAFYGLKLEIWSFVNKTPIGVTMGRMYISAMVAPGKHIFWSKCDKILSIELDIPSIELDIEAGKTYYIRQNMLMGPFKAYVTLEVVTKKDWEKAMKKCKRSKTNDTDMEKGEKIASKEFEIAKINLT